MSPRETPERRLHLVVLTDGLLLVKRGHADWRALPDEFPDFKTSLGPYDLAEVLELIGAEWPAVLARREEIVAFEASNATEMRL